MSAKPKVLFLSPEAIPFAKTGGLADVSGALPIALKGLGADVRLALPWYRAIIQKNIKATLLPDHLPVPLGNRTLKAGVLTTSTPEGMPCYFIEREDLYDRPNLYGTADGDYYDNLERYAFFSHGALRLAEALSFQPDIIHCHDWQTGLVPALVQGSYGKGSQWAGTKVVFTIHNLGYQGIFPAEKLPLTGLPGADFFHPEGLEFWGDISLLKAGIVYADAVTTVSPTYAREIRTPEFGKGMEGILRKRGETFHGILNGVDYTLWDPAGDPHIPANYSLDHMEGKAKCKKILIKETTLDTALLERPLLGMVTRIDNQKGLDLFMEILDQLFDLDVGLIILGTGERSLEDALRKKARDFSSRMRVFIAYDETLARRIYAATDFFLVPSRYEPCGLTQMYALKYGSIPVVRATGGLADTIKPFDPGTGKGNGFTFIPYESAAFLQAVRQAVRIFEMPESWNTLRANGMKEDFSWKRSAQKYLELYESLM